MLVYIADENFNIKYIIDYYKSVIWNSKMYDLSDFEIYLPVIDNSILDVIKPNFFTWLDVDITDRRVIENIKINYTITDGYTITISGHDARTLIKRRIIKYPIQLPYEVVVNFLAHDAYRNNVLELYTDQEQDTNRIIDYFNPNTYLDSYTYMYSQLYGENVFEKIKELEMIDEIGTRTVYADNKFTLHAIKGFNRTSNQSVYKRVIFSSELGNLLEFSIELDTTEFKNVAYILGEGSGINRTITVSGDVDSKGIERYETTVNASELSLNTGTSSAISQEHYIDILKGAGEQYLTNLNKIYKFDCKINFDMYKFKTDFDLGDKVEIVTDFKINNSNSVKARVTEVTESWSDKGYECLPVLDFDL